MQAIAMAGLLVSFMSVRCTVATTHTCGTRTPPPKQKTAHLPAWLYPLRLPSARRVAKGSSPKAFR